MRVNRLKECWRNGEAAVNGWLSMPSTYAAEIMAHAGWTTLTIDLQHGAIDDAAAFAMLQAISTTEVVPVVRVRWNEPSAVMRALDAGACAVICPMVNDRDEAERFVGACRFPPRGYRSFGPNRAALYGGSDYHEHADERVATIAMIETAAGLANVDEIAATPELDAVYIGPADLSYALTGHYGGDHVEGVCYEAMLRILEAARRHGIVAGIHSERPEYAARMIDLGFRFVTAGSDARLLATAAQRAVAGVTSAPHAPAPRRDRRS